MPDKNRIVADYSREAPKNLPMPDKNRIVAYYSRSPEGPAQLALTFDAEDQPVTFHSQSRFVVICGYCSHAK